jgi:BsuBI/PstI restriction endonuclease HTH domain
MEFMRVEYGKDYKPNSRETIRRQTIHQFEQARLVDRNPDEPDRPTNSGKNAYRLTEEVTEVLKAFGTAGFDKAVATFIKQFGTLKAAYERARVSHQIPLRLADGSTVYLSPGEHTERCIENETRRSVRRLCWGHRPSGSTPATPGLAAENPGWLGSSRLCRRSPQKG